MKILLVFLGMGVLSPLAMAAPSSGCEEQPTLPLLATRVSLIQEALRLDRISIAQRRLKLMRQALPCVEAPVPAVLIAQVRFYEAWLVWRLGDSIRAGRLLRSALAVHGELEWDPELGSTAAQRDFLQLFNDAQHWRDYRAQPSQIRIKVRGDQDVLYVDGRAYTRRAEPYPLFPGRHLLQRKHRGRWFGVWLDLEEESLAVVARATFADAPQKQSRIRVAGVPSPSPEMAPSQGRKEARWAWTVVPAVSVLQPGGARVLRAAMFTSGVQLGLQRSLRHQGLLAADLEILPVGVYRDVASQLPEQDRGQAARDGQVNAALSGQPLRLAATVGAGYVWQRPRDAEGAFIFQVGGLYSSQELLDYYQSEDGEVNQTEYVRIGRFAGASAGLGLESRRQGVTGGHLGWLGRLTISVGAGAFLPGEVDSGVDSEWLVALDPGIVPFVQIGLGMGIYWR